MATFLFVQGLDPVELAEEESFNKVRQRINQAVTGTTRDGEAKDKKDRARPLHELSFLTAEGGRVSINPEKIIGVGSDTAKDTE